MPLSASEGSREAGCRRITSGQSRLAIRIWSRDVRSTVSRAGSQPKPYIYRISSGRKPIELSLIASLTGVRTSFSQPSNGGSKTIAVERSRTSGDM